MIYAPARNVGRRRRPLFIPRQSIMLIHVVALPCVGAEVLQVSRFVGKTAWFCRSSLLLSNRSA